MCRRFTIIKNIDRLSVEDLVNYLKRVVKIYCILACFAIYNAVTAYTNSSGFLVVIKILSAIVYTLYTGCLIYFTQGPTFFNLHFPLLSASALDVIYVVSLLLQIFESSYKGAAAKANIAISVVTALFSIVLLSSMIYILLKLRTKMLFRDAGMENPEEPIMVVAIPIQPTAPMKMDSNA